MGIEKPPPIPFALRNMRSISILICYCFLFYYIMYSCLCVPIKNKTLVLFFYCIFSLILGWISFLQKIHYALFPYFCLINNLYYPINWWIVYCFSYHSDAIQHLLWIWQNLVQIDSIGTAIWFRLTWRSHNDNFHFKGNI